jgi:hypothetical protein
MARGPFATFLALRLKKLGRCTTVIFDGRGAYVAELTEYNVVGDESVVRDIREIEKKAVLDSDFRLAVSEALVNYWKSSFHYTGTKHVIIPCTLSSAFDYEIPEERELLQLKEQMGYKKDDILLIYSGSSAGWQSLQLLDENLLHWMKRDSRLHLLMMTEKTGRELEVVKQFTSRVNFVWVKPSEVRKYLLAGDYGILYREKNVTNRVASPVKFAEYLACGLKVIISEELGDCSGFVQKHQLGQIGFGQDFQPQPYSERIRFRQLAKNSFYKENYKSSYLKLLQ